MHANAPVNRIMSAPVLSISADASISDAVRLFMRHPIHHLPVLAHGRLAGMLSAADVLPRRLHSVSPPPADFQDRSHLTVSAIMSTPVVKLLEHDSLEYAVSLMAGNGIHALPVVNGEEQLIGILTTTDVLRCSLDTASSVRDPQSAQRTAPLAEDRVAIALAHARTAVNTHHDPHGIAATLLWTQRRATALEEVAFTAKRYLNAGQDPQLHRALSKAIERADRLEETLRHPAVIDDL
jgi:CBS domain-containing protein